MKKYIMSLMLIFALVSCGEIPPELASINETLPDNKEPLKETLKFRFINVGQGDSTLLITPKKRAILIDAGTPEMGRERVISVIEDSFARLELIIASHYDTDHIGGISEVIKGTDGIINTADDLIPYSGIIDRGIPENIGTPSLSDYLILSAGLSRSMSPGDMFAIDGVSFELICENGRFKDGTNITIDPENENAHSLSFLIRYGEISFLTSGDLPGPNFPNKYEPYDLEKYLPPLTGTVDILHVSHHGSHNSTNKEFVDNIKPQIAIISVGKNDYGHPNQTVIDNLLNAGAHVYLTEGDWIDSGERINIVGNDICAETDGTSIEVTGC